MAISMELRVLASKLEKSSDNLIVEASRKNPEVFEKVATAIAAASTLLEDVAQDVDQNDDHRITEEQWDEAIETIKAFRDTGDEFLTKHASVMEELLLSIAAPKNAASESRKVTEDEINRLRAERRRGRGEEAYKKPAQELHDMWNSQAQAKAVEQQVKRYVPLEAALQTRYPPDRPGGQMTRITDHVYQDITTGIIYDFKNGYTTQKGNKIPGGSVENQTRQLGDYRNQSTSLFESRDSLMGRYAAENPEHFVKAASALKAVRDQAPELLNEALDCAYDDGFSSTIIGEILADTTATQANVKEALVSVGWAAVKESVEQGKIAVALNAIQELAPHLLRRGIDAAKRAGLTDQQIKSILAGNFVGNFNSTLGENGEVQAAEALFPQLRAVGWFDMLDDHLKVMAKSGVSQEALNKLAGASSKKKSNINTSNSFRMLKLAFSERMGLQKDDSPLESLAKLYVTAESAEKAEENVDEYTFGTEAPPVSLNPQTGEIEGSPTMEPIENPSQPAVQPQAPAAPVTGLMTPNEDLELWKGVYADAKEGVLRPKDEEKKRAIREEIRRVSKAQGPAAADQRLKELVNEEMRGYGAIGAFERDENGDEWWVVAEELARLTPQAAPPVAPEPEDDEEEVESQEDKVPANNEGKEFDWEKYQQEHGVTVTESQARKLEEKWASLYDNARLKFNQVAEEYKFKGGKVPRSIDVLPKAAKKLIMSMYVRREKTEATYKLLERQLKDFLLEENPDMTDMEAKQEANDRMPSVAELKQARLAIKANENERRAKELEQMAQSTARVAAINLQLKELGLPPMFPIKELMTIKKFREKMSELGDLDSEDFQKVKEWEDYKKRFETKKPEEGGHPLVHLPPWGEDGQRLETLYDNPEGYMQSIASVVVPLQQNSNLKQFRRMPKSVIEKINAKLKEEGFVPMDYPLFGKNGTIGLMLSGALSPKKNPVDVTKEELFPDFGALKNLFDNPAEYATHWEKGKDIFMPKSAEEWGKVDNNGRPLKFDRTPPPRQFDEIHVAETSETANIPYEIKQDIRALYEDRPTDEDGIPLSPQKKLEEAKFAMKSKRNLEPDVTEAVWKTFQRSDDRAKADIMSAINKGKDPREIYEAIMNKYPGIYLPPEMVEGEGDDARIAESLYDFFKNKKAHNDAVSQRWNAWSEKNGFYPPNKAVVGENLTSHKLLSPKMYFGDDDRFGSWSLGA